MTISVCMAAYNGTRYIQEQINSILPQLEPDDELIIVDDASGDHTVQLVLSYDDRRIRLLRNERNQGVIRSVERALANAAGDLIFLSDQDDVWRPNKVTVFKTYFQTKSNITVALSDAHVIDRDGNEISPSWNANRKFTPGLIRNFIRNRYLGCSMVFRRSVLRYCLPFPPDIPMHDLWIGLINEVYGEAGFINEALVGYRRHGENVTSESHASIQQMLAWRWRLATSLGGRVMDVSRTIS